MHPSFAVQDTSENEQLRTRNKQLTDELSILKKQFSQTVLLDEQLRGLRDTNTQLRKTVQTKESQVEELTHRLEISQQNAKENERQLNQTISNLRNSTSSEVNQTKAFYQTELNKCDSKSLEQEAKIQQLNSDFFTLQKEVSQFRAQHSTLLTAAAHRYRDDFRSLQDLTDFLMRPKTPPSLPQHDAIEDVVPREKYEALKTKYHQVVDYADNVELELEKLRGEAQSLDSIKEQLNNEYEDKFLELSNQVARVEIEALVKPESPKTTRKRNQSSQTQPLTPEKIVKTVEVNSPVLLDQNQTLVQQIDQIQQENFALKQKCTSLKKNNRDLELQLNDLQRKELITQPQTVVVEKAPAPEIIIEKADNAPVLEITEQILQSQSEEIELLQKQKEALISSLQKLMAVDLSCSQILEPVIVTEQVLEREKILWNFKPLPAELATVCCDVTINEHEAATKQAAHLLQVIGKWISTKTEGYDIQVLNLKRDAQRAEERAESFHRLVLDALENPHLSDDQVLSEIHQMKRDLVFLQAELNQKKAEIDEFKDAFGGESIERIPGHVKELEQNAQLLQNLLAKEKNKRRNLGSKMKDVLDLVQAQMEEQASTLHETQISAENQAISFQREIEELQEQNKNLALQLEKERNQHQTQLEDLEKEHDDQILALNEQIDEVQQNSNDFSNPEIDLSNILEKSKEWESKAIKLMQNNAKLEHMLTKMREEKEQILSDTDEQLKRERLQSDTRFSELLKKLNQMEIEQADQLTSAEEEKRKIKANEIQLSRQVLDQQRTIEKMEMSCRAEAESHQREQRLQSAHSQSKLLQMEISCRNEIEDNLRKWKSEERELYGIVARAFPSLVDTTRPLDRDSFMKLCFEIKREMEDMNHSMRTVRKLLKAEETDSIEDALTAFVLSNHPALHSPSPF